MRVLPLRWPGDGLAMAGRIMKEVGAHRNRPADPAARLQLARVPGGSGRAAARRTRRACSGRGGGHAAGRAHHPDVRCHDRALRQTQALTLSIVNAPSLVTELKGTMGTHS